MLALAALHGQDLIHGNIVSDQIFTSKFGSVKLEFNGYLAKLTREKTFRETKYGSFGSLAPELLKD